MKYLKQFAIILTVTCIGEFLNYALPLPIPASIYGLVLMLLLLMTGILKLEQVDNTATFLVEIMPVMFIPAGVGLLTAIDTLRPILIPVLIITVVTTFLVMGVTGKVTDLVIARTRGSKEISEENIIDELERKEFSSETTDTTIEGGISDHE